MTLDEACAELADAFEDLLDAAQIEAELWFDDELGPNAIATAEGDVVIGTELVECLGPELCVGICAHELAHLLDRHLQTRAALASASRGVVRVGFELGRARYGLLGGLVAAAVGATTAAVGNAALMQHQEMSADELAAELLEAAGFSPCLLEEALEAIEAEVGDGGGGPLSTHPRLSRRIESLRRR